jgi:uncharacterized cupin superfamily protein
MRSVNIHQPEFTLDQTQPGYRWRAAELGPAIGAEQMGATIYELPPGEASFPYHYEYGCEEWLLVVAGSVTLRDPDGEHVVATGDLICFPEGETGAHRVHNAGPEAARVMFFSTKGRPAVAVFPDSGKLVLCSGGGASDDVIARKADSVSYWEGES